MEHPSLKISGVEKDLKSGISSLIDVDLSSSATLIFEKEKVLAEKTPSIRWSLNFGLPLEKLVEANEALIHILGFALSKWEKELYLAFGGEVLLFSVSYSFFYGEPFYKRNLLSELCQDLTSFLREPVDLVLEFEEKIPLLWRHPDAFRGFICHPPRGNPKHDTGFLLPPLEEFDEDLYERVPELNRLRILTESNFGENWDGLHTLYVLEKSLSPLGKRWVSGFKASGGNLVQL